MSISIICTKQKFGMHQNKAKENERLPPHPDLLVV